MQKSKHRIYYYLPMYIQMHKTKMPKPIRTLFSATRVAIRVKL